MPQLVELLAYSRGPHSKPVATFRLRYPRFVHAELMTHRVLSRNASSSRAVPVKRLIDDVIRDPVFPMHWGKNQPGMQAREELEGEALELAKRAWLLARDEAVNAAHRMINAGAHKQFANRVLEPFSHINVICTGTDWANFFALRCHPDAQPEIRDLAEKMRALLETNEPKLLQSGEWHLPLVDPEDWNHGDLEVMKKVSVARCARVSYFTFDGKRSTVEDDVKLYDKLLGSEPLHSSPAEHQCTPDSWLDHGWCDPSFHGNLMGWIQLRKLLPNECVWG